MHSAIHVCPLSRLEDTVAQTGARYVITAINPWSIPATPSNVVDENHLRLAVNDIDAPYGDLVHPEAHHIDELISFSQKWNRDGPIVVHCLAGVSRSSAAAFIAACALNDTTPENEIAFCLRNASKTARPNPLMIRIADDQLNRNGRMIAAIGALSPSASVMEATPFSIPSYY